MAPSKSQLLRFPGAARRDSPSQDWLREHTGVLGVIAQRWFEVMRACGDDMRGRLDAVAGRGR